MSVVLDLAFKPVPQEELQTRLTPELVDVDLTGNKLHELPDLSELNAMEALCLRQNYITALDKLPSEVGSLVRLDAYDNKLTEQGSAAVARFVNLQYLDLSFNEVRSIAHVSELTQLTELYYIQNKIQAINTNLTNLTNLTMLELGSNRIREIENLSTLVNLRKLFLGRNKITAIKGLDTLVNLKCLSLQFNRLTELSGLDNLVNLEELYVSNNGLTQFGGLDSLTKLRILDVGHNFLERVENLDAQESLEDLWCSGNKFEDFAEVEKLKQFPKLTTVYFEHTPLYRSVDYRMHVLCILPGLEQLDADDVSDQERQTARDLVAKQEREALKDAGAS